MFVEPVLLADYMLITFIIGLVGGWVIGYITSNKIKPND